jgi:GAF domain-containing protein
MDGAYAAEIADVVLSLHEQPDVEQTLDQIMMYIKEATSSDGVGIMLVHGGKRVETAAATDPLVRQADEVQHATGEGPCLEAIWSHDNYLVHDAETDPRWPVWGPKVAVLGYHSLLSVRLFTLRSTIGALNLHAHRTQAFDEDDIEIAHVFGRHASVALAAVRQEKGLREAITARHLIGQAQGILMERFALDADRAFAVLRRYSQDNNVKLREVAQRIIATRRLPSEP